MYGQNDIKITVKTADLLRTLKANRDLHRATYETAKEGYRILLAKELEKKLAAVKGGKKVSLSFKCQKPDSHLGDYDDVIGMLELSDDAKITVNHQQYKQYYKDEWDWSHNWSTSNVMNLSASAGSL